jgi:hypothetical protein
VSDHGGYAAVSFYSATHLMVGCADGAVVSYQLTNGFFRKDTYVEGFETFMFDRFYLDNNVAAATTSESVVTLSRSTFNNARYEKANFTMDDDDRILALRKSSVPGGDGSQVFFNALMNSYRDISLNPGVAVSNILLTEFPD